MTYKHATLPVSNLQIFQENPRFQPQVNQDAAISKVLLNRKIFGLLADIAKNGLDPSESIMVFNSEQENNYIVKEGNRRITAVKLLNDPELVPKSFPNRRDLIKRITDIKKKTNYQPLSNVRCVVFEEDGELLDHFIELKHTGENKGAGRIGWDTESQTRFKKQKDPYKNYLLNFITQIHPAYQDSSGFTTFERIISDPNIRKAIGMEIDRKKPIIILSDDFSKKKLFYIIDCLIKKTIKVSDVYDKELRLKFIENHLKTQEQLNIIEKLYNTYNKDVVQPPVNPTTGTTGVQPPVNPTTGTTGIQPPVNPTTGTTGVQPPVNPTTGTTGIQPPVNPTTGTTGIQPPVNPTTGTTGIQPPVNPTTGTTGIQPPVNPTTGTTGIQPPVNPTTGTTGIQPPVNPTTGTTGVQPPVNPTTGTTGVQPPVNPTTGTTGVQPPVNPTTGTTGIQPPVNPTTGTTGVQNNSKNVTDLYKSKKLQSACKFNRYYTNNARIRGTLFEINNTQIEEMPIALTYLIRSFLENYAHEYIDFHLTLEGNLRIKGVAREREKRKELRELLLIIKDHLYSNYVIASDIVALIEEVCDKSDHKNPLTTKLNIFVHSNLSIPSSRQVIDLWLKACPIAQQLDLALAQKLEQK
ncbi:hypothetical protein EXW48_19975 [Bacillus wiedmannii]|uniref:hypothetical protein n=1 Tax=Bacillus wiedmannii TaxID=1890302 RepID=UPI001C00B38A|nr:hypothetical protein [Bacillus wiedmannii]QWI18108.1 hypothetical protein EXW48_19975 [Bacillus wiedmannii]